MQRTDEPCGSNNDREAEVSILLFWLPYDDDRYEDEKFSRVNEANRHVGTGR